jgi:hypothetical protein
VQLFIPDTAPSSPQFQGLVNNKCIASCALSSHSC